MYSSHKDMTEEEKKLRISQLDTAQKIILCLLDSHSKYSMTKSEYDRWAKKRKEHIMELNALREI